MVMWSVAEWMRAEIRHYVYILSMVRLVSVCSCPGQSSVPHLGRLRRYLLAHEGEGRRVHAMRQLRHAAAVDAVLEHRHGGRRLQRTGPTSFSPPPPRC